MKFEVFSLITKYMINYGTKNVFLDYMTFDNKKAISD